MSSAPEPRRLPTELVWLAGAVLLALVVGGAYLAQSALSGDGGGDAGGGDGTIPPRVISPADGTAVSSPVTLNVTSSGIKIAPPEDGVAGAAHYAAFLNVHPFTPGGKVIPSNDDRIHHFATDTLELDLKPGSYLLIVALGDNDNVRLTNAPAVSVDFVVK